MQEDQTQHPVAALFPLAKAQFIIKEASVTRKIPQAICYTAGNTDIRDYLMERNSWTENTLDDIHWHAHGVGHLHHQTQQCYLAKMCHHHLPLGETLHRCVAKYSPICPGCRDEAELQDHYIQCQAPSRMKWRMALLATLRKQMEKTNTNKYLQETILVRINNVMADRTINTNGPFHQVLEAQACIGWVSMLSGYWLQTWQIEYDSMYIIPIDETRKAKNKCSLQMACWQKRKLVQTVWGSMIKLWKTCNNERHKWDKESRDSASQAVLHKELEAIYVQKHEYPHKVQQLLRTSYKKHTEENVTKIANWLDAYKGTFAVTWSPN
jgi:hypothetical protein